MSVKIRLSLTGKTHQISYRVVAQDTRSKRDGKFLEILGHLNPHQKKDAIKIDKERIKYYLSHGATFTPSAKYVFENGKLPPKPKKKKEQKTEPETKSEEAKTEEKTTDKSKPQEAQEVKPLDLKEVKPDEPKEKNEPLSENNEKNE